MHTAATESVLLCVRMKSSARLLNSNVRYVEDWLNNVLLKKDQLPQWVLWVSKGKSELKSSHIARYLSYGKHQTFGEGKVSLVAAHGKARHIAMNCLACRSGVQFPFL